MADVFITHLEWLGAARGPTRDPATFSRDLDIVVHTVVIPVSAAPRYRGDPSRVNPEQLLVASLSACQALTYLYLAARHGVAVAGYTDDAEGRLGLLDGKMRMVSITLRPRITLEAGADETAARALVETAHRECFIANSVSAAVRIEPTIESARMASAVATETP